MIHHLPNHLKEKMKLKDYANLNPPVKMNSNNSIKVAKSFVVFAAFFALVLPAVYADTLETSVINAGGGSISSSSFTLAVTSIGEGVAGTMSSSSFSLEAGFSPTSQGSPSVSSTSTSAGSGGGRGSTTPPQIGDSTSSVLSITADGFAAIFDVSLNDPFATAVLNPEDRVILTLDLFEPRGINSIRHVALYFSEKENNLANLKNSETFITYEKNEPLLVKDPEGFFSDVKFDIIEIDVSNFVLKYDIGFASPMGLSDMLLYMYDEDRRIGQKFFESAIEVVPTEISDTKILELNIESEPIFSSQVFNEWTGYSTSIVSDEEFLSHLGVEGKKIPDWLKKNNAEWVHDLLITQQDLVNAIKYLHERGII